MMIDIAEHRDGLYNFLISFNATVQFEREQNPDLGIGPIVNNFLDNEISMQKAWQEIAEYEHAVNQYNNRILRAIRSVKGKTFAKYLDAIIEEADRVQGKMELVKAPTGKYQTENYGRTIKGMWVDQWSRGDSGDSFAGYICVQLKERLYLKFAYEC